MIQKPIPRKSKPKSFNPSPSSRLVNEDIYKRKKDEMMKKFEHNIQKTMESLHRYQLDDLSNSDEDEFDQASLREKLNFRSKNGFSDLKDLNSNSTSSPKNDSNSLANGKSQYSNMMNHNRVKISDIIGNKTRSDVKEDINKKWNFHSDSDEDEDSDDNENDDENVDPEIHEKEDINRYYNDLKTQFEKKFSNEILENEKKSENKNLKKNFGFDMSSEKKKDDGNLKIGNSSKFEIEDDSDDDDFDLEKLKQITKDKFGINFGLNSSSCSESEKNENSEKKKIFENPATSEEIRRIEQQMLNIQGDSDSDSDEELKKNLDQKKFEESDLMKKINSGQTGFRRLEDEFGDPELKEKINFFSNKFLKEKTQEFPLGKKEDEIDKEDKEDDIPSWKRDLESKFKKFDNFKKKQLSDSNSGNNSLADYKIDNSNSTKFDNFLKKKTSKKNFEIEIETEEPKQEKIHQIQQKMFTNQINTPKFNPLDTRTNPKILHDKIYNANHLKKENQFLKEKLSEIEENSRREKEIMKEQHNSILKSHIERHQGNSEMMRNQYESEIDHLRSELAKARKELLNFQSERHKQEKEVEKPETFDKKTQVIIKTKENETTNNVNLERNFLKLKELYDTLYKANITLMKDQKDLESKYSKLLRAYNKQNQRGGKKGKRTGKPKNQQQNLKRKSASRKKKREKSRNPSITSSIKGSVSSKRNNRVKSKGASRHRRKEKDSKLSIDETLTSYICHTETSFGNNGQNSRILNPSEFGEKRDESLFTNSLIQKSVKMRKVKKKRKKRASRSNSKKRYLGKDMENKSALVTEKPNQYSSNFIYESHPIYLNSDEANWEIRHEKYMTNNQRKRDDSQSNRSNNRYGSSGKRKKKKIRNKVPKARKCMLTNNPNYF